MYHSINFGNKNTWDDWRLIPTSRPVFLPPDVKKVLVDLPGSDGVIDLTESLTGYVKYGNRKGSFEFRVHTKRDWVDVYSTIMDYLHGQKMKIILDDDPGYYYLGRAYVNEWKSQKNNSVIVIDAEVEPYKYELFGSLEEWEWDPFNFETGIIREYGNIEVDGNKTITIDGNRRPVVPKFTIASTDGNGMRIRQTTGNNRTYTVQDGTVRIPEIVIVEGINKIRFDGYGTVSIGYRGGRL